MDLLELKAYMKTYGFDSYREDNNLNVYIYSKDNKLIRFFMLSSGNMVYLEHKIKSGSITNIKDIDRINEEFNELNIFIKHIKEKLAK